MVSRRLTRQLVCWLLCLYAAALSIAAAAPVVAPSVEHHAMAGMHCHEDAPAKKHHANCSDSCLLGCLLTSAPGAPSAETRLAGDVCPVLLHGLSPASGPALPAFALLAPLPPRGPPSLS